MEVGSLTTVSVDGLSQRSTRTRDLINQETTGPGPRLHFLFEKSNKRKVKSNNNERTEK